MKAIPISKPYFSKLFIGISIILLITLFLYAAYNKLIIYSTFKEQLKLSPITTGFESILAWLIPLTEITISLLLIFPRTRLGGLYSSFFLMLLFTLYVFIVPHFFPGKTCSCGGIISEFSWKEHFWFNVFFTLLAAAGLILYSQYQNKNSTN